MEALLTIIIPAYNEAESLPSVLPILLSKCQIENWKVIVVNDGSADNTSEVLKTFGAEENLKIVSHKVNRGYGGAIKTGIINVTTKYCVTFDADGQHQVDDIKLILNKMVDTDADLIVGNRVGNKASSAFRETGKWIIRKIAKILMPINIYDINSGLKMYDTNLAKKYVAICPNSMAYSDIITLIFISQKHLVLEEKIKITKRIAGKSTIGVKTAFQTVIEIINILMLFNPLRIFIPLSIFFGIITTMWEIPLLIKGNGLSVGALFGYIFSVVVFLLGLIAEQLGLIRKLIVNNNE
ncbi:MAG: glycosyltransferase family 2 protein [Bacteroidetes bacterium]|nr:glycosyltransferase family 2 protein [Bacteroidota bacterium]